MNRFKVLHIMILSVLLFGGCSGIHPNNKLQTMDLNPLLISKKDLPTTLWTVYGPNNVQLDRERTDDLVGIAFFSDLYPNHLGSSQKIYRYQSVKEAKWDYEYASNYFGNGYFPDKWIFSSAIADESHIGCRNNSSTVTFPVCYWIARYDCIVIEFRAWLIPDRMTLKDMENIVRKIDEKAGVFLQAYGR